MAKLARDTLIRAWRPSSGVWPTPEAAVRQLLPIPTARIVTFSGLQIKLVPSIPSEREDFDIAAVLDIARRTIWLAEGTYSDAERNLTLAHELGHFLKDGGQSSKVYRERIMKGSDIEDWKRPLAEREADWFAVGFTMPERLVNEAFHSRYGLPISLDRVDEQLVYWLESGTGKRLSISEIRSRGLNHLAYLLSINTWFAGRYFDPLTKEFCVTPTAMSIRLRELHLVS